MLNLYSLLAYNLFGKYYAKKRIDFFGLRHSLLRNRMDMSYDVYMSCALLSSIISAFLSLIGVSLLFLVFGVPEIKATRIMFPGWVAPFLQYKSIVLGLIFGVIFIILVFTIVYKLFQIYPSVMAGDRKGKIDSMLPYAVNYMSAMSGAGVLPVDLFRSLATNDIYGEMSVECRYLVRDLEILGHDLVSAMKNLAVTTPSSALQDFLQGAITVVTSGGQLESYFRIKTDQYIMENRQSQKEFLETLGLLGETYVTAFVAGPLFLVVVISIMSIMGNAQMIYLYIIIYALIPIGSIMYVVVISMLTPEV